jgi:hypothetical protein
MPTGPSRSPRTTLIIQRVRNGCLLMCRRNSVLTRSIVGVICGGRGQRAGTPDDDGFGDLVSEALVATVWLADVGICGIGNCLRRIFTAATTYRSTMLIQSVMTACFYNIVLDAWVIDRVMRRIELSLYELVSCSSDHRSPCGTSL